MLAIIYLNEILTKELDSKVKFFKGLLHVLPKLPFEIVKQKVPNQLQSPSFPHVYLFCIYNDGGEQSYLPSNKGAACATAGVKVRVMIFRIDFDPRLIMGASASLFLSRYL